MGLLAVTAMATGVGAGNLVQYALSVNPMIVVQSGVGTILTFLSFSLSALTAQRRSWWASLGHKGAGAYSAIEYVRNQLYRSGGSLRSSPHPQSSHLFLLARPRHNRVLITLRSVTAQT